VFANRRIIGRSRHIIQVGNLILYVTHVAGLGNMVGMAANMPNSVGRVNKNINTDEPVMFIIGADYEKLSKC